MRQKYLPIAALGWVLTLFPAISLWAEEAADNALVGVVIELLRDKDKDIRALALEQVRAEVKGSAATTLFAAELQKLPPEAQVGLLRALAGRGDSAARPAVLDLLAKSQDSAVQTAALATLGVLGTIEDLPLLVEQLSTPAAEKQDAARASLIQLRGDQASRLLAERLASSEQVAARIALMEILAERRAVESLPTLLPLAAHSDPALRSAAMTALGQLAREQEIPGLLAGILATEPGRERDAAEKTLATVCARIADPQARSERVLQATRTFHAGEQLTLLTALGRVGGSAVLEEIEAKITSPETAWHEAGVRALCNWPDASVADRLQEIATSDQSEALRISALRALIRVAPMADDRSDAQRLALLNTAMKLATRDDERLLVLDRARVIRDLAALRFLVPYLDEPKFAEQACLSVVELAHHRTLRQPNKAEFDRALDKVIQTSQDAVVIDRANRYQKDQTWVRPAKEK